MTWRHVRYKHAGGRPTSKPNTRSGRCFLTTRAEFGPPGPFWYAAQPSSLSGRLARDGGREICGGAFHEGAGDVGETLVGVAGVVAEHGEGAVHVDAEPLGELALGLLDHDPAVQRGLKLLGHGFGAAYVAFVQQA